MKAPEFLIYKSEVAPWFIEVRFRYHFKLKEYIRSIPGASYVPGSKSWLVPVEMLNAVKMEAIRHGFAVSNKQL